MSALIEIDRRITFLLTLGRRPRFLPLAAALFDQALAELNALPGIVTRPDNVRVLRPMFRGVVLVRKPGRQSARIDAK